MKKRTLSRRFKMSAYSAWKLALLITIIVAVNLVVSALPSSVTEFDLTGDDLYALSPQTEQIAQNLDQDVQMYLLAPSGSENQVLLRLLARYEELSPHITVSSVDPVSDPTFLSAYDIDLDTLFTNSVLTVSGSRYRLVGYDRIFVTEQHTLEDGSASTSTAFHGEHALTNAIHYVSNAAMPKVYALSGHGEAALESDVKTLIHNDNLQLETLSLLSLEDVPQDCACLIINVPASDIAPEEAQKLIRYLKKGGNMILLTDYIKQGAMENLLSVTAFMGMTAGEGMVLEGDSSRHVSRYPYYLLPYMSNHAITAPLNESSLYVLLPIAQLLSPVNGAGASVQPLLITSEKAYAKADGLDTQTLSQEDTDVTGPFNVGALATKSQGTLLWVPSSMFLISSANTMVSGGNYNLFMNALSYLCDQAETLSIRAKTVTGSVISVPASVQGTVTVLLIGVIPLAVAALGAIVCIRRKRR